MYLIGLLFGKFLNHKDFDEPVKKPYRRIHADDILIIDVPEMLDYWVFLVGNEAKHSRSLRQIQCPNTDIGICHRRSISPAWLCCRTNSDRSQFTMSILRCSLE
ncbi:Conserved hypothetical protein [Geobacillus thermodenitrificans NG80-2]|uniref:Uncharacterized protein n=1 Tax=Geobacillus thermodenitrificans (strain NG80-2) TaxID=420246 RepID=A4IT54_GEOTN|nr:Conserved hypothetical protein [Geobacillus thermodenitrificans NG80-2]